MRLFYKIWACVNAYNPLPPKTKLLKYGEQMHGLCKSSHGLKFVTLVITPIFYTSHVRMYVEATIALRFFVPMRTLLKQLSPHKLQGEHELKQVFI